MHDHLIPSAKFATWLLHIIDNVLRWIGIDHSSHAQDDVYLVSVIIVAILTGWIIQKIIVVIVKKAMRVKFMKFLSNLQERDVLSRCGRVIPPLVLLSLIPFAFNSDHSTTRILFLVTIIYFTITLAIAINSVLSTVWLYYNSHHNNKNLPLRGVLDITRGAVWVIAVCIILAFIVNKSPWALLTGLGAFAAVIMLIFKDSILGVVAGIQFSDNDMLRVGDWISIPGTPTNGIVIDVSLIVVKVRNWNNTVSMVAPYSLITGTYINWRYMKQGGSRHIQMWVNIDVNTVRPLSDDELHALQQKLPLIKDFIDVKMKQRAAGQTHNVFNTEAGADGTIDTNLGLMRAYMLIYLKQHPYVITERMHMVRILQPTTCGYPMEIFAYLSTADWPAYEAIQADMFEHIAAIAPTFGLSVYMAPTTRSIYDIGVTDRQGAPYYGDAPVYTPTPKPESNTFTPPPTADQ